MQEQINDNAEQLLEKSSEKLWVISVKATKITGRILAKAIKQAIKIHNRKSNQGKISVKKLVKQGDGISNVAITDKNIKSFERTARKYGVTFALKKDKTTDKWMVFFKARDADVLTAALKEYSAKILRKKKDKPSVLASLKKIKELVSKRVMDKEKNKSRGAPTRW